MQVYDMEQGEKCSKWINQSADQAHRALGSNTNSNGSNFTTPEDEYDKSKPMRRLRDSIVELATSKLAHPLSEQTIKEIEDCLRNIFFDSYMNTPDHPPYSEMIFKAIESLNTNGKEGGAKKASISAFIKSEFHDLAWAHESLLSQHLGKLMERGEVLVTSPSGNYGVSTSRFGTKTCFAASKTTKTETRKLTSWQS